jgi:hypothetical protein
MPSKRKVKKLGGRQKVTMQKCAGKKISLKLMGGQVSGIIKNDCSDITPYLINIQYT